MIILEQYVSSCKLLRCCLRLRGRPVVDDPQLELSGEYRTWTSARDAVECLRVFVSASWTIRYAETSTMDGSSRRSPSTLIATARSESRMPAASRGSSPRPGLRRQIVAVTGLSEEPEQAVQLQDRLAAGRLDRAQRLLGLVAIAVEHDPGGARLDAHHADVVGDDVVQVTRDPHPLLEHRARAFSSRSRSARTARSSAASACAACP